MCFESCGLVSALPAQTSSTCAIDARVTFSAFLRTLVCDRFAACVLLPTRYAGALDEISAAMPVFGFHYLAPEP